MDNNINQLEQSKAVEEKLKKITKKISKARKDIAKSKNKEAAEFEEIHQLLKKADNANNSPEDSDIESLDCNILPLISTGKIIFHDNRIFSIFNHKTLLLKDFISPKEFSEIFGYKNVTSPEDCIRKLVLCHVDENLMQKDEKNSSLSLYVLYLMSVHQNSAFVLTCFDFLKYNLFQLHLKDIFPILVNFGGKEDLFELNEEHQIRKFNRKNEECQGIKFPFFNMEMVGKILLHYITADLIQIEPEISLLVKGLAKITLDPKVRSGNLLPLFSTLLTTLCLVANEYFKLEEITSWLFFKDERPLEQLEICRIVSKSIFPDLHDSLVLTTASSLLNLRTSLNKVPIKINFLKCVLKKLKYKKLPPVEFYCVLQLVNNSLPGTTATEEDSLEINATLASLVKEVNKIEDLVNVIRLKVEIAKVGNLVINNKRSHIDETLRTYAKKVKCSN